MIGFQYEHVAKEGAKFALVNGKAVEIVKPRSSQTLLRDFDPIFERQKPHQPKVDGQLLFEDDEDETSSVTSSSSSSASSEITEGASSVVFASNSQFHDDLDPLKEADSVNSVSFFNLNCQICFTYILVRKEASSRG